jgi:DNA-binding CsgD family transcriptional regulator
VRESAEQARRAVMHVIETESAAYLARDYEGWARCWVHEPHLQRWVSGGRGHAAWAGWEQHAKRMKSFMAAHPEPSAAEYRREELNIRVGKEIAWVSFLQFAPGSSGAFVDLPEATNEMRVLEMDAEGWKIAYLCSFHRSVEHISSALVRVDQQAAVLWMNSAAEHELRNSASIAIRAGRLRAANRVADQRLQAAIRWAGPIDETHYDLPRQGNLPIVLDGGSGEPANVCWVIAHNNQILVAINDRHMTEERLAAAAAVYNITPAQARLAGLIVAGHDLVDAAGRLGVSVNTTRTHLQRMFDKTGVRSQPALVRALLSVAAPLG